MECSTEKFLPHKMILKFAALDRHNIKVPALHGFAGIKLGQEGDRKDINQVLGNKVVFEVAQVTSYSVVVGSHRGP